MNLKAMKNDSINEDFFKEKYEEMGKLNLNRFGEQNALNRYIGHKVLILPQIYNLQYYVLGSILPDSDDKTRTMIDDYKLRTFGSKTKYNTGIEDAVILHFAGLTKPWNWSVKYLWRKYYFTALSQTMFFTPLDRLHMIWENIVPNFVCELVNLLRKYILSLSLSSLK